MNSGAVKKMMLVRSRNLLYLRSKKHRRPQFTRSDARAGTRRNCMQGSRGAGEQGAREQARTHARKQIRMQANTQTDTLNPRHTTEQEWHLLISQHIALGHRKRFHVDVSQHETNVTTSGGELDSLEFLELRLDRRQLGLEMLLLRGSTFCSQLLSKLAHLLYFGQSGCSIVIRVRCAID